jgi:AcrR family transcriptional regulator
MIEWSHWLLKSAAAEYALNGFMNADIDQVAQVAGISRELLYQRFGDKRRIALTLIDEIAEAHKSNILQKLGGIEDPSRRGVGFITASFEFVELNPSLGQVIVHALFSTDVTLRDRVYEAYAKVFALILPELEKMGVIPNQSYAIASDLSTILLSVIFTGGCPQLMMEYTSWLDPQRVALSLLEALRKRYETIDIQASFL